MAHGMRQGRKCTVSDAVLTPSRASLLGNPRPIPRCRISLCVPREWEVWRRYNEFREVYNSVAVAEVPSITAPSIRK